MICSVKHNSSVASKDQPKSKNKERKSLKKNVSTNRKSISNLNKKDEKRKSEYLAMIAADMKN